MEKEPTKKEGVPVSWKSVSGTTDAILGKIMDYELETRGVALTNIGTGDNYIIDVVSKNPLEIDLYEPPIKYGKFKKFSTFAQLVKYVESIKVEAEEKFGDLYIYKEYYYEGDKGWSLYVRVEPEELFAVPSRGGVCRVRHRKMEG